MKCVASCNNMNHWKIPPLEFFVIYFRTPANFLLTTEKSQKFALDFWQFGGYTLNNLKMVSKRSTPWKGVSFTWLQCTGYKRPNFRYSGYVVSFISLTGQVPFFQDLFFPHPIDSGVRNFF